MVGARNIYPLSPPLVESKSMIRQIDLFFFLLFRFLGEREGDEKEEGVSEYNTMVRLLGRSVSPKPGKPPG